VDFGLPKSKTLPKGAEMRTKEVKQNQVKKLPDIAIWNGVPKTSDAIALGVAGGVISLVENPVATSIVAVAAALGWRIYEKRSKNEKD
jgi:hypothetical protein